MMKELSERPLCHRAEDLVSFLYDEASAAEARDFADHAAQCDACRAELASFRQVHDSVMMWRNEALGANSVNAAAPLIETTVTMQRSRKLSALAALREFFTVSPIWLRGATAFAALLLCVLALVVISRSVRPSAPVAQNASDEKKYSQKDLDDAVSQKLAEQQAQNSTATTNGSSHETVITSPGSKQNTPSVIVRNATPKRSQRVAGLTRAEREQLAADLRLMPGREDEELPFVFSEEPDQR